jgi:hypothetical protein
MRHIRVIYGRRVVIWVSITLPADYELNVDGRLRTALAARISLFCTPGPTGVEVVIRLAGNHMIDPLRPLLQRAPGKGQQPRW